MSFGERLNQVLRRNEIKKKDFAESLSISPSTVSRWLKSVKPNGGMIEKLQGIFCEKDFQYLVSGKDSFELNLPQDGNFTISIRIERA